LHGSKSTYNAGCLQAGTIEKALTPLQCSASSEAATCTSSPPCVDRVAKLSPLQSPGASFVDLENLKELQAGNLAVDMMSVPGTGAMAAVKT